MLIALPGLIPRSSPMAWFVTLLAVFGAPVGIELIVSLHRTGWFDALSFALLVPSTVLVALIIAAGVKKGIYPWCSEGVSSDRFWILQFVILLGGILMAALVSVTLSNHVCWGDFYRVHSSFYFPKLDTGNYPGFSLFVNFLIGVTVSYPFIVLAQASLYRRAKRTDWLRSFFSLEVQSLAFLCIAFVCWALPPLFAAVLVNSGHPTYFNEQFTIRDSFRTLVTLTTIPVSFAGMMTAFASAKNVRIPWSYNLAPVLVGGNFVAVLLIAICLCIQSCFPTAFLVVDSSINHLLGRERRALISLNEAIRIQPMDPGLYRQRAEINRSLGERSAAASDYDKCLALGGVHSDAYSYLIYYKDSKGDLAGARRLADLYLDKHPNSADAYIWCADLHQAVGEEELARFDYNEALKRLSSRSSGLEDACYVNVRLGNLKESERISRLLIKTWPSYFEFHHRLSQVLNKQHRYREAVRAASESIKLNPRTHASYCVRGAALYNLGVYRKALPDLNKAIDLQSRFGKALYYRSRVYEKLGEKSLAASDLAESKRLGYSTEDDMWF